MALSAERQMLDETLGIGAKCVLSNPLTAPFHDGIPVFHSQADGRERIEFDLIDDDGFIR